MAQRPTRRDVRMVQQAQPQQQQLGLDTLMPMLAHLYNIQQQQQLQPGVLKEQDLKAKLAEFNLLNAPKDAANKKALEDAQIKHLTDEKLPTVYPYLPEGPVKRAVEEAAFPELKAQRQQQEHVAQAQKWSGLLGDARVQGVPQDKFGPIDSEWGPGMGQYLAGLKGTATPTTPPPPIAGAGAALGTGLRTGFNIPQHLQSVDDSMTNAGMGFWASLLGLDPTKSAPVAPSLVQQFNKLIGYDPSSF